MSRTGLSERLLIASVRARGLQRKTASRLLGGTFLRWPQHRRDPRPLVIIPQDLRTVDPSFLTELRSGHLGFAGTVVFHDDRSPFDIAPPNAAWARALHGFGWLRHLAAARESGASSLACGMIMTWLRSRTTGVAVEPAVRARRILSWIAHASFVLDGAPAADFDAFSRGLAREVGQLASQWRTSNEGHERLVVLTALVAYELATNGPERRLYATLTRLDAEIERQILADGGHISRNPAVLIDLLLDWLPLRTCFPAQHDQLRETLSFAIARMMSMLRFLRLGDGRVARFNGMATGDPAGLATLLAYDDRPMAAWMIAPQSRYARLAQGTMVALIDVGSPPPLAHAGMAQAGCLSMEVSTGTQLLFVNSGTPCGADAAWSAVARATASHSTLCLGEVSSSRLVRHDSVEALLGAVPLQLPATVMAKAWVDADGARLAASHDGYLDRLGVIHRRELTLAADGHSLSGVETMATNGDRLKRDVPFAVHFHLHPDATCAREAANPARDGVHIIQLRDGQRWMFQASGPVGSKTSLEESTHFAGSSGPRPSLQLVVRGVTAGVSAITWSATRLP